jgi:hypothetical protein
MNWLSAVSAALAVTLTTGFAWRLTRRPAVALLAGGLLALSTTFWTYSLAAERYTLNLALLVGAIWLAWEAAQSGHPRFAYASALLLGLSLTVHPTDALLTPFWLAYLAWSMPAHRSSLRFWVLLAVCGAAPMLLYAYVPWRWLAASDAPPAAGIGRSSAIYQGMVHVWYQPELTPALLWKYIGGLGGYGSSLAAGGWRDALMRVPEVVPYWRAELPAVVLLAAVAGAVWLGRRHGSLLAALVGFAALLTLVVAYIQQGKYEAYQLPAFWVTLFLAALSLGWAADGMARLGESRGASGRAGQGALLLAVGLGLLLILQQQYGRLDRSRETEAARWWDVTLRQPIEPDAGLLGHWSDFTPLWYLQQIEGKRTDLLGLFPPDMDQVVMPWVEAGRPLYLAAPLQEWAVDLPARLQMTPWGTVVRLTRYGEDVPCPPMANAAQPADGWPFALTSWQTDEPLSGAAPGALRFCYQARSELPRNTFLALEMRRAGDAVPLRANEPLISQWYPLEQTPAGVAGMATVPLPLPQGAPPGRYELTLTPYLMQEDGAPLALPGAAPQTLGQVEVQPTRGFRRALLKDEIAPLIPQRAGPLLLRGWRLSEEAVRPGDPVRLDMVWEILAPLKQPVELAVAFYAPDGVKATRAQPVFASATDAGLAPGTLLYATYTLQAPRERGDREYRVEAGLHAGGRWLPWLPAGRLSLGTVTVRDRPHIEHMPADTQSRTADFGDVAQLRGHAPLPSEIAAGETLPITLYWEARAPTDASYRVFVHLVNSRGEILAQHDGSPADGALPTNIWAPGEIIEDPHALVLPADLAPGAYKLRLGLYLPDTGERLPVTGDPPQADNALEIGTITVAPRQQ